MQHLAILAKCMKIVKSFVFQAFRKMIRDIYDTDKERIEP